MGVVGDNELRTDYGRLDLGWREKGRRPSRLRGCADPARYKTKPRSPPVKFQRVLVAVAAALSFAAGAQAPAAAAAASTAAPAPATAPAAPSAPAAATAGTESGKVAYYGRKFSHRRTASGERFNPAALTMAHKTLPFGTRVRVTNTKNHRSVIVRVNDRGPSTADRVGDLSLAAARRLHMLRSGVIEAQLEVLGGGAAHGARHHSRARHGKH
ncbi:MAG: septal ring lytic transglycosylase RlpA family protein [Burkholderiales bacterium]|nr:septal ring lytic transglycosylase RlpA family protein [Burkholderiales bacterium]